MKLKLKPIFKDISLTFIAEAVVLIAFFFIYRLIAKNFGPEGVGKYSLVRRVIGFFWPLLILGLGVGIPRYIAMSQDKNQRSAYMSSAGLVVMGFTFVFLILISLFKAYFAKIFFGSIEYTNLVLPFSFFLAGLILHVLIYSYFRGRLFVKTFNLLQIINLALVPLGILILFKNINIEKLIGLTGITTFIISFSFSLFFIKEFFNRIEVQELKSSLKELLRYSLPRVPGDFALAGILSLGPIFATHFASIQEVGYLSISQSLLNVSVIAIAPLSIILLPKASNLIVQARQKTIKNNVNFLIGAVLQCFLFATVQLLVFADIVIKYWLGSEFFGAIPVMRIVFISIIFYAFYLTMRSILDAVEVKPLNAINLFISLGILMVIGGMLLFIFDFFSPIISLSIAFTSALFCLGILTYISIRKIYPENLNKDLKHLWIAIIINILLGGIAILTKPFIISRLFYLIIFEMVLSLIYLLSLWLLKMEWIRQVPGKIRG